MNSLCNTALDTHRSTKIHTYIYPSLLNMLNKDIPRERNYREREPNPITEIEREPTLLSTDTLRVEHKDRHCRQTREHLESIALR